MSLNIIYAGMNDNYMSAVPDKESGGLEVSVLYNRVCTIIGYIVYCPDNERWFGYDTLASLEAGEYQIQGPLENCLAYMDNKAKEIINK